MEKDGLVNRKQVLIVDDEPDITSFVSEILEGHEFNVQSVHTAMEAEAIIKESPPDLVLLDLMMPGRTGIQLFVRLKGDETTRHIPLIMVTGIKDKLNIDWKEIVGRFKARVPDGFVEKPIEPIRLMSVVEEVMAKACEGGKPA